MSTGQSSWFAGVRRALLVLVVVVGCAGGTKPAAVPGQQQTAGAGGPADAGVHIAQSGRLANGPVPLSELGMVVGAAYDQALGRLLILGNGIDLDASPTEQEIAIALSRVNGARVRPWLSIDPTKDGPEAPEMEVNASDEVANTDFGWVMLEADRRLKSFALGRDNVSGQVASSSVAGFSNRLQLGQARGSQGDSGFQRFWLRPTDRSEALVSPRGLRIGAGGMQVATEGQALRGGKLVDSSANRDPLAAELAAFVSNHYPEFARDEPSFKRLEQLRRLAVVGEWARDGAIPVRLDWIARAGARHFPLPGRTPTLKVQAARSSHEVVREQGGIRTRNTYATIGAVGGASLQELKVTLTRSAPVDYEAVPTEVVQALAPGQATRFDNRGKQLVAYAVATRDAARDPAKLEPLLQIQVPSGGVAVEARVADADDYPARAGVDRVVALPTLRAANPRDDVEDARGVAGVADSVVLIRRYELYGADGALLGHFARHEIDQARSRVVVLPDDSHSTLRLYPHGIHKGKDGNDHPGGATVVGFADGAQRTFDVETGVLVAEQYGDARIDYAYNERLLPASISLVLAGAAPKQLVEFSHDAGGALVVAARTSDGRSEQLAPARTGALAATIAEARLAPADVAEATKDAQSAPVLLAHGGYTVLFDGSDVTVLQASVRSPRSLLAQVRARLAQARSEARSEVFDIQPVDTERAGVLMHSGGVAYYDEVTDQAPRKRVKGAAALEEYHRTMARRVSLAARNGERFVYWARAGDQLRIWSADRIIDLPFASIQTLGPEHLAAILGPAGGPTFLLSQGFELAPETKPLALALARHAVNTRRSLYLARDLELAVQNYRRIGTLRRAADVVTTVFHNFNAARALGPSLKHLSGTGARYALSDELDIDAGLRGNDGSRPALIVYAHNDEAFQTWLGDAGSKGQLANRSVLAVTCDDASNSVRLSALLASSGAVAFANALERVEPGVLGDVTAELGSLFTELEKKPLAGDALLAEAIDRALANPQNQHNEALLQRLRALRYALLIQLSLTTPKAKGHYG